MTIIGIDLGTTKSVVSVVENGKPIIIDNNGKRITPSVVAWKKAKNSPVPALLVGDTAKNQAISNPGNTFYGVKRLIGRRFDDPKVKKMMETASYKIVQNAAGDAAVEATMPIFDESAQLSVPQISAEVLRSLKKAAEKYLGEEVTEAVITVPAYFDDAQRQATKDAAAIAGLKVRQIINEPTAAALAYGIDKKTEGSVIVYDLGGGTFDVSVLEINDDGMLTFSVLAADGDTFLGGENFDERIMSYLLGELKDNYGLDLLADRAKNAPALQTLKTQAEAAKIALSSQEIFDINVPYVGLDADGEMINFETALTRAKLEELVMDLIERTKEPCEKALKAAALKNPNISKKTIDAILLVGAQTRMPKVAEYVEGIFGKKPLANLAAQEIVAMGAAVQGAALKGEVNNVLLSDVTPLPIGIRTAGDVFSELIPANSQIPFRYETDIGNAFTTSENGQKNVEIIIYQGSRAIASENRRIGSFVFDIDPPLPAGALKLGITIDLDANGMMTVTAKDLVTGRTRKETLQANGGLTAEEVERMKRDAEEHAEEDRLFKENLVVISVAEQELKEARLAVEKDYYKQAPEDMKAEFDGLRDELTAACQNKNVEEMKLKAKEMVAMRSKMGLAFYEASNKKEADASSEADASPEVDTPKP